MSIGDVNPCDRIMAGVSVGGRIRELRASAGLTQAALAKPLYTVSYISKIESGERTPSPAALAHIADRLGVSSAYLATGMADDLEDALKFKLEEAREHLRERALDRAEAAA